MKTYKGFNEDLTCRGFQYEIGKEYEESEAVVCEKGFHACEMPLDVFKYYAPATSRFFEVEQSGEISKTSDNSKVSSTKIKIGAEIGIPGLVKAQIEWVKSKASEHAEKSPVDTATGYQGVASATEDYGTASATGECGVASATGCRGAASATGECGAASATGDQGAASATGDQGAASATGEYGAASATGIRGAASAIGYQGAASVTGNWGAASATGYQGAASATGYQGAASATGYQGAASATGNEGIAMASGYKGKVMGASGCAIVCCERGNWDGEKYPLISVRSGIVDGETLKPYVWYTVRDGEWVEVESES